MTLIQSCVNQYNQYIYPKIEVYTRNVVVQYDRYVAPKVDLVADFIFNSIDMAVNEINSYRRLLPNSINDCIDVVLEEIKNLIDRVSKISLETLIITCSLIGVVPIVTVPAIAFKVYTIVKPVIQELVMGAGSPQDFNKALNSIEDGMRREIGMLRPHMHEATTIAALFYGVTSILSGSLADTAKAITCYVISLAVV